MSVISTLIENLEEMARWDELTDKPRAKVIRDATDTIRELSAKLHTAMMERSSQYYNGGWIPCEDQMPKDGEPVLVTVKTGEWISDYGNDRVPEDEKIWHPAEEGTFVGRVYGVSWIVTGIDGHECIDRIDVADKIGGDLGVVYRMVTAWRPLPEPYKGGSQ